MSRIAWFVFSIAAALALLAGACSSPPSDEQAIENVTMAGPGPTTNAGDDSPDVEAADVVYKDTQRPTRWGFDLPELKLPFPSTATIERGVGAFDDPGPMVMGQSFPLVYTVAPDAAALALANEGRATTRPQPVFLSQLMRVRMLRDPNFEITPVSDSVQATGLDKTATWQWSIRPLRDGSYQLFALVEVVEQTPGGELKVHDSYTRRVSVRVRIGTWEGFIRALRRASSLGEVLATLFASWEKTLTALAALVGAISTLVLAVRGFGRWKRKRRAA